MRAGQRDDLWSWQKHARVERSWSRAFAHKQTGRCCGMLVVGLVFYWNSAWSSHQCANSVTVLREHPSFFWAVFFTLTSSVGLFSPSLCFLCLTISHEPTMIYFFPPFFSLYAITALSLFLSYFPYVSFSGLLCPRVGRGVHEHVHKTNSMRHTVQMEALLSLWLPLRKVNRGRAIVRPSVCVIQKRITATQWE